MTPRGIPDPVEEAIRGALRGIPRPWRAAVADQILRARKRRGKRGRNPEDGGVPVEPDKPRGLEGGAAAALEFDN